MINICYLAIRENNQFHLLHGTEMLFLLNILTRAPDNRQLFKKEPIIASITALMKWMLLGYKIPFVVDVKDIETNEDIEQLFSQVLLANCFQIILNFITFHGVWGDPTHITVMDTIVDWHPINMAKQELFRLGILNIIKGYLDHMNSILSKGQLKGSQIEFRQLLLNVLGALLEDEPDINTSIIQSGVLDTIVTWIGWPDIYSKTSDL